MLWCGFGALDCRITLAVPNQKSELSEMTVGWHGQKRTELVEIFSENRKQIGNQTSRIGIFSPNRAVIVI